MGRGRSEADGPQESRALLSPNLLYSPGLPGEGGI